MAGIGMNHSQLEHRDYWRAIILYGINTATYKIALGQCLVGFARQGKTTVTMHELAEEFFTLYLERLRTGKPQLMLPNRRTVMERIVDQYNLGKLSRTAAVDRVETEAFGDVVPRFHTVNNLAVPVKFYEQADGRLVITDSLFEVFSSEDSIGLEGELGSRWDLLEAAFEMKRENSHLINDIRRFYLDRGYDRTDITHTRPVLNGYQKGLCFYCGVPLKDSDVHVDHCIPRQLVSHDEIWNLVLAHDFCNSQKSDALPGPAYVEKLIQRNEHFIASNHPIKAKLIEQLGPTAKHRRTYVHQVYSDARAVIKYTWEGIRGYNPDTDPFYKSFVRCLST